jgi:hypothetical protein
MLDTFDALSDRSTDLDFEIFVASPQPAAGSGAANDADVMLIDVLAQSLRATGYPALRNLTVELVAGRIVLAGQVPTYHQKQLAQSVVQRVDQAREIANNIEVSGGR